MRQNDYYGHYKAFVKALYDNPELTLKEYCTGHGLIWRRLYDWMHRHKISLKRLYDTYRGDMSHPVSCGDSELPRFCEILPSGVNPHTKPGAEAPADVIYMSRILLPTGVVIELKDCPVPALSVLLRQCMGKEVADVLP